MRRFLILFKNASDLFTKNKLGRFRAGEKEGALVRGRRVHELVEEHAEVEADLGGEVRALVALLVKVGLDAVHVVGERLEEGLCHK